MATLQAFNCTSRSLDTSHNWKPVSRCLLIHGNRSGVDCGVIPHKADPADEAHLPAATTNLTLSTTVILSYNAVGFIRWLAVRGNMELKPENRGS
jgi:hypothetical protein